MHQSCGRDLFPKKLQVVLDPPHSWAGAAQDLHDCRGKVDEHHVAALYATAGSSLVLRIIEVRRMLGIWCNCHEMCSGLDFIPKVFVGRSNAWIKSEPARQQKTIGER
jgi:hypothetical protein